MDNIWGFLSVVAICVTVAVCVLVPGWFSRRGCFHCEATRKEIENIRRVCAGIDQNLNQVWDRLSRLVISVPPYQEK